MLDCNLPPDYLPPRKPYHGLRNMVRDPASVPIGSERAAAGGSKLRYQIFASGSSSRPSSSQTVSDTPVAEAAVDSPIELSPSTGDGDVTPKVGPREDTDVNQSCLEIPELAMDNAPMSAYHNGDAWYLAGPASGANSEQIPHNAVPSVDRPSCPFMQVASTSSAETPSYPEDPVSFVAARQMREEQRLREEQDRRDARLREEQHSQRKREEAELNSRFERPQTSEARNACSREHVHMLTRRANHVCSGPHCFDETCTIDLPERQGCRFANSFHSNDTAPCIWGWGSMLREYTTRFGERIAMTTSLDEIARWHLQRRKFAQRFEGPVLVKDPPEGSNEGNVVWIINPSE
jgi:hypothetical protein